MSEIILTGRKTQIKKKSLVSICVAQQAVFSLTRATSWENLFMPYVNNKGADQPAHPHSLISTFIVCCPDSIIPLLAVVEISRLWLVSSAEKTSSSCNRSQTRKTGFLMTWLNSNGTTLKACFLMTSYFVLQTWRKPTISWTSAATCSTRSAQIHIPRTWVPVATIPQSQHHPGRRLSSLTRTVHKTAE